MNYYQFHINDYLAHTAHLSPLEDIAYRRLIDLYYQSDGEYERNTNVIRLSRKIRMPAHEDVVESVLTEFFTVENGQYRHKRCDEELQKYKEKQEKARSSIAARWDKNKEIEPKSPKKPSSKASDPKTTARERNTNVIRTYYEGNTNQEPITNIYISDIDKSISSSGKENLPDITPRKKTLDELRQEAISEVCNYLNTQTGRKYTHGASCWGNLRQQFRQLKEPEIEPKVEICKLVIDSKWSEWGDTERAKYVRPETLFAPKHWESYVQDAEDWSKSRAPTVKTRKLDIVDGELREVKIESS